MSKKYILNNSVYFGDGVHPAGQVIELEDSVAEGYLERGSISEYDPSQETAGEGVGESAVQVEAPVEEQAEEVVETPTEAPVPPAVTADPTPEQIAQTLKEAGV